MALSQNFRLAPPEQLACRNTFKMLISSPISSMKTHIGDYLKPHLCKRPFLLRLDGVVVIPSLNRLVEQFGSSKLLVSMLHFSF